MVQRYIEKLQTLFKVLGMVYRLRPLHSLGRDLLFVITTILEMAMIGLGGKFLDATADILIHWKEFNITEYFYSDSFYYLALGLGFWMIVNVLSKFRDYLKENIKNFVLFYMQGTLLDVISRSNLEDVETKHFRDLLTFVPNFSYDHVIDTYDKFSDAVSGIFKASSALYILFGYVGYTAFLLPLLALPENIIAHIRRKKRRAYNDKEVETLKKVDYLQTVMTRIQYFPELRVDNSFTSLKSKYGKNAMKYMKGYLKHMELFYVDTALYAVIDRLAMTIYVIYALAVSIVQKTTIGTFKAIYDYAVASYQGAFDALWSIFRISNHVEYSKKYFEYEEFKGFGDLDHGDQALGKGVPSLELKNIKFKYPGSKRRSLKKINLRIEPGEKVAIIGKDGSGKSSLVKIMCGLYRVTEGKYLIDDISIVDLDRGQLKKKMSVVFQDFVNYNLTLRENITLMSDSKRIDTDLYKKVCDVFEIDDIIKKEGIDDDQVLGKYFAKGQEISPGYWQRLAMARMLYRNKDIILMDEPFLYVDEESRRMILRNLIKYAKEKTIIFITQDLSNLKHFDKVYHLKQGELIPKKISKKK